MVSERFKQTWIDLVVTNPVRGTASLYQFDNMSVLQTRKNLQTLVQHGNAMTIYSDISKCPLPTVQVFNCHTLFTARLTNFTSPSELTAPSIAPSFTTCGNLKERIPLPLRHIHATQYSF